MKEEEKPGICLHCLLVEVINRHAEAVGELDHTAILMALAQVTTQIMRDIMGVEQYPEDGLAPDAERPAKPH